MGLMIAIDHRIVVRVAQMHEDSTVFGDQFDRTAAPREVDLRNQAPAC
jgi:hypothetical protein